MGFGFPAAMGVKRGVPDKVSINFSGDGVAGLDSAIELAESYKNNESLDEQCNSLIRW
jgi:thiamine pyrophosphate-dependent acetolactate synthase large subunit-like protein